jgi:hypothetical protein
MRPRVKPCYCPLHSRRGARKGKVSSASARISVLSALQIIDEPCCFRRAPSCLCRSVSESTRLERLGLRDSWRMLYQPTHNRHALFSPDSFDWPGAFLVVRQAQRLQPHARRPRSAATLADQFSRNSAHETLEILLPPSASSIPGAIGPWNGIIPCGADVQTCSGKSHVTCVSCFMPQPALRPPCSGCCCCCCECECLWAGCRRKEAGSSCGLVDPVLVHAKTHSQHQRSTYCIQFHYSRFPSPLPVQTP